MIPTEKKPDCLYICAPCYGHRPVQNVAAIMGSTGSAVPWRAVNVEQISVSLLAYAFNLGLAKAYNKRDVYSHFLLWHDDIAPTSPEWLKVMHDEMAATGAHVLSVPMPIKDHTGDVSMCVPTDGPWTVKRIHSSTILNMPETWVCNDPPAPLAGKKVLVNTGLMLIDLRWPGLLEPDPLAFTISDTIRKEDEGYTARVSPEDWRFSRDVYARGGRIAVTRKVHAIHIGRHGFTNQETWGKPHD